ncbi:MAG: condensin subunit MukF [Polyangiaceae bacterium]|jgi:chromosome partition protein MukF
MPSHGPSCSPSPILSRLARRGVTLELGTIDLCFLVALTLRAEHSALASFTEDQLIDVFEQVCQAVEPEAEVRRVATHAIRRLRDQHMLSRVDGAGVVRAGEYTLTRLATGIVDFHLADESLTRESLTLLLRTLSESVATALDAARRASSADEWRALVVAPLRVTVGDLVQGIERRQRGFDAQKEQFQRDVAGLLQADWFGAVDRCQALLDATTETLRELGDVLLIHATAIHGALQDILELAASAGAAEAEAATRRVVEQIDRIAAWSGARQRAWSEYYQYVHRFLRDVVRIDPTRVLTHRLREQLTGSAGEGFALRVASAASIRLLRPVRPPAEGRPPVRRRSGEPETTVTDVASVDPQAKLDTDVRAAVDGGARSLAEVTALLTAGMPPGERYVAAGRIALAVARVCRPLTTADRPWVSVADDLVIEEWAVPEAS